MSLSPYSMKSADLMTTVLQQQQHHQHQHHRESGASSFTGEEEQQQQHDGEDEENDENNQGLSPIDLNKQIIKEISDIYESHSGRSKVSKHRKATSKAASASAAAAAGGGGGGEQQVLHGLGLKSIGRLLKEPVSMGHSKAAIMVVGNISAGKSTFINWYAQQQVQKTGMAVETSGFTYVTYGRSIAEIGGESTLNLRPHLHDVAAKFPGFCENLRMKTSPSRNNRLQLVDLIDTPGLADGDLQYQFDVEDVIFEMRKCVDLYLIFFDPIGQALSKRLLSLVKRLNDCCPDKLRFCLSKVDDVRTEEERVKIMCQTTQSLTSKINTKHGFDLIPIFIAGGKEGKYITNIETESGNGSEDEDSFNSSRSGARRSKNVQNASQRIMNRVNDLVEDIDRIIERRVQDALNTLILDVNKLTSITDKKIEEFAKMKFEILNWNRKRRWNSVYRFLLFIISLFVALFHLKVCRHPKVSNQIDNLLASVDPQLLDLANQATAQLRSIPYLFLILWSFISVFFVSTISFRSPVVLSMSRKIDFQNIAAAKDFLFIARKWWKQLNRSYFRNALNDNNSSSTSNVYSD